jgi:two-component system cell cycle response regulator
VTVSRLRILIVEREENSAARVESDLRSGGFTQVERCGPAHAAEATSRKRPGFVFIEFTGPETAEVCRAVRQAAAPGFVPVLMLIAEDPASVVRGFEAGADDCVHWPRFHRGEMLARVRSMVRIKSLHDELQALNAQLTELSMRDGLTGLYNRRYLFERLSSEVERAVRYQQSLSCIMLDMDEFKPVNDRYGHLVGDELLRRAAEVFRSIPRRVDIVARYGGDEVAMLLPATGLDAALAVASRVCGTMSARTFKIGARELTSTVSLGVACLDPAGPLTGDELVRRADVALYASKHAGGNRVTVWHEGM